MRGGQLCFRYAHGVVQKVRKEAKLPEHLTLAACRHGGSTELGDADLTESQEMALTGCTQPSTKRRYVKKTEAQRLLAARKRRTFRESAGG